MSDSSSSKPTKSQVKKMESNSSKRKKETTPKSPKKKVKKTKKKKKTTVASDNAQHDAKDSGVSVDAKENQVQDRQDDQDTQNDDGDHDEYAHMQEDEEHEEVHCNNEDDEFEEDDGFGVSDYGFDNLIGNNDTPHPSTFLCNKAEYFANINPGDPETGEMGDLQIVFKDNEKISTHDTPNNVYVRRRGQKVGNLNVILPPAVIASSSMHPNGTYDQQMTREKFESDPTKDAHNMGNYSFQMLLSERAMVVSHKTKRGMDAEVQRYFHWIETVRKQVIKFMCSDPRCMRSFKSEVRVEFKDSYPEKAADESEFEAFLYKRCLISKFRKTYSVPKDKETKMPSGDNRFFSTGAPIFTTVYPDDSRGPTSFIKANPELLQKYEEEGLKYNHIRVFDVGHDPVKELDPRYPTLANGNICSAAVQVRGTYGAGKYGIQLKLTSAYKFGNAKVGGGSLSSRALLNVQSASEYFNPSATPVLESDSALNSKDWLGKPLTQIEENVTAMTVVD